MQIRVTLPLLYLVTLSVISAALLADPSTSPTTFPSTSPSTNPSGSVWDGVYSPEQLARGEKSYNSACARCHGDNLLGNDSAPALVGDDFLGHWLGNSVGTLVNYTWQKMPSDGPGRLSRQQSTDITTYLLSQNDFPAGKKDLVSDPNVLKQILIEEKK